MPRPKKNETYLLKKKADLQAEIDRLMKERRETERAIEADLRKQQLAWEASVGRLAWNAGLHGIKFEMLEAYFYAILHPEDLDDADVAPPPAQRVALAVG